MTQRHLNAQQRNTPRQYQPTRTHQHAPASIKTPATHILPQSTKDIKAEWDRQTDPVLQFVEDKCELSPEHNIESGKMYQAYKLWVQDTGTRCVSQNNLTARLKKFAVTSAKSTGGKRYLHGIRLKESY